MHQCTFESVCVICCFHWFSCWRHSYRTQRNIGVTHRERNIGVTCLISCWILIIFLEMRFLSWKINSSMRILLWQNAKKSIFSRMLAGTKMTLWTAYHMKHFSKISLATMLKWPNRRGRNTNHQSKFRLDPGRSRPKNRWHQIPIVSDDLCIISMFRFDPFGRPHRGSL